jgi:AcrR family transcriptional regulator
MGSMAKKSAAKSKADDQTKGVRSREKLIQAAIQVIAKEGLGGASFQQVADAAGLKQSSLFYYFANKDELVESVIGEIIVRSQAYFSKQQSMHDDAYNRLLKYFHATLAWAQENPQEAEVLYLLYYYGAMQKKFAVLYSRVLAAARNRILEMLLAGEREKLFAPPLPPEKTAVLLHDALLGGVINASSVRRAGPEWGEDGAKWEPLIRVLTGMPTAPGPS